MMTETESVNTDTYTENPPDAEVDMDQIMRDEFPSDKHLECRVRQAEYEAKQWWKKLQEEKAQALAHPQSGKTPVFTLDECMERIKYGPFDFSTILSANASILNDFFEFHLRHSKQSEKTQETLMMALRAQSQMVRTLNTMVRFHNFQNGETE